jgi:hypothetical protein
MNTEQKYISVFAKTSDELFAELKKLVKIYPKIKICEVSSAKEIGYRWSVDFKTVEKIPDDVENKFGMLLEYEAAR